MRRGSDGGEGLYCTDCTEKMDAAEERKQVKSICSVMFYFHFFYLSCFVLFLLSTKNEAVARGKQKGSVWPCWKAFFGVECAAMTTANNRQQTRRELQNMCFPQIVTLSHEQSLEETKVRRLR